jgi:hypothetical protein
MEIFTKNSAKCTVFQSTICNKFSSLMGSVTTSIGALVESEGIGAKGQGTANGTQSARFVSYFVP